MSKKYMRDLIPLVVICLISALLLASFNLITKDAIASNTLREQEATRARLLTSAASFEALELKEDSNMESFYQGLDENGEPVGYVIQTIVNGYGGEIVVTIGMDMDGAITGIDVGGENFSETPGLGALAKEPAFSNQYIGKSVPLKLVKGNEPKGDDTIDAISGATRTSAAVNGGVNLAGKYIADLMGGGSANTASAQGFGGPVAVTLELDGSGAISSIVIGDDYFNETEGYGKRALEEAFWSQFIGMTPPLTMGDIDALSGATVTSTAVVNAINTVYAQLTGEGAPEQPAPTDPAGATTVASADASGASFADGVWTASAQGFASPVAVKLTLDGLTITSIEIGDEQFNETEGFGKKALEDEFKAQFVGKTLPLTLEDIDAISGATMTSTAVITAIGDIYEAAGEGAPAMAPVSDVAWTATATAEGFAGPVTVKLALDGMTITAIEIGDDQFAETAGLGAKALEDEFKSQFIGKTLPIALEDIDAIAGATFTSKAVVDAIGEIYEAIAGVAATEEPIVSEEPVATVEPVATEEPAATAEPVASEEATTFTASAQGFAGPVAVTLTLDGLTVTSIEIGDDQFAETEGFGKKALDDEFKAQFIGKTLPIALTDIDAISGATFTSTAVITAIGDIYAQASEAAPAEEAAFPATFTASAKGFAGPVAVTLSLDGLTVTGIEIGDDQFAETDGLGAKALEDEFKSQFIGKTLPIALTDIDAISGATFTTQAVIDAIGDIYTQATEAAPASDSATFTASAKGFVGPVAVTLSLDGLTVTGIEIGDDQFAETDGLGAKALEDEFKSQFIGKTLPIALTDIDAISGATFTTQAVIDAIDEIYQSVK